MAKKYFAGCDVGSTYTKAVILDEQGNIVAHTTIRSKINSEQSAQIAMQEVVDQLHDEYGWSDSVSNLSGKLQRESLRYREAVELADVLGYDVVWQKRRD